MDHVGTDMPRDISITEVIEWCNANLGDRWYIVGGIMFLHNEDDRFLFRLRWDGCQTSWIS